MIHSQSKRRVRECPPTKIAKKIGIKTLENNVLSKRQKNTRIMFVLYFALVIPICLILSQPHSEKARKM